MTGNRRTPIPRSSARKRKPGSKPSPPRPKGEIERLARRRCDAMKYRLAGASYRAIAEKLTEERAQAYADAHGVSVERAMKKIPHVSKRTAWDDVTAEWEELRRETEMQRADLMALENARLDQGFSKALSLFAKGSVPAGRLAIATMGRRCLFVAGSLPVRVPPRAGVEVRGERVVRGIAVGSEPVPRSLGVGHFGVLCFSSTTTYRYFRTAPRAAVAPARVVRDHAGGFPVAGQHDFRGGRAARRQFGREPDPAAVRRHARLDAGGGGRPAVKRR